MCRNALILSALFVSCLIGGRHAIAADDAELDDVRAKVDDMFEQIKPEHVNASPVDGWYAIQKGSIIAYISADGRYLLQGDLIDLDLQVNLSEQARNETRRELLASLDDDEFITFAPENVKYSITVFTDVDCTYCRKLHSEIDDYMAQGIAVRYLLYPRNGPASRAWRTAEEVWCARDRNVALTAAKLQQPFETQKCDASAISEHYILGQDVGLTGTPALVFDDGTILSGYLPPAALASRLQLMQETAAANSE